MTDDEAPERWLVEGEAGEVRNVEAWRQPSRLWRATLPGTTMGAGRGFTTPRAAVVDLAVRHGWPVVAVLAPGQPTRAESEAARERAEERSRLHAADANRAAERWAAANGRLAAADVEIATASRLRDDAGRLADMLRAERDALRSLLAAAARGELPRCPTCSVRFATRETVRGDLRRWCDECDAARVLRYPDEAGNRRDAPHAVALRAAMVGEGS